ncbi:flagellar basal body-associated protein FliL [Photobacterium japonica]|uniref:flagellar basal body-associated protein FliL n=1 Tax=Photobacterium japonica TaxID=2910235 RepID=UPI003D1031A5
MAEDSNASSKKKRLMLIVGVVLLLVGGGAGAWWMFGNEATPAAISPTVSTLPATTTPVVEPAYYVILPQPFIFNVTGDRRDRLVQVKVQLLVRGERNEATANQHVPLVESTLLQTFGAATVEQLRAPGGRADLRTYALKAVQDALVKVSGRPVVERVLFTGFVMQ